MLTFAKTEIVGNYFSFESSVEMVRLILRITALMYEKVLCVIKSSFFKKKLT